MFWHTIRCLGEKRSLAAFFIEDSNSVMLKDLDPILNRWRDYLSDLLNPVDATLTQIHEEQTGEDIQLIETKMRMQLSNH